VTVSARYSNGGLYESECVGSFARGAGKYARPLIFNVKSSSPSHRSAGPVSALCLCKSFRRWSGFFRKLRMMRSTVLASHLDGTNLRFGSRADGSTTLSSAVFSWNWSPKKLLGKMPPRSLRINSSCYFLGMDVNVVSRCRGTGWVVVVCVSVGNVVSLRDKEHRHVSVPTTPGNPSVTHLFLGNRNLLVLAFVEHLPPVRGVVHHLQQVV